MGLTKNLALYISIILILVLSPNFVESAGTHYCSEVDTSACTAISATSISTNTLSLSSISSLNKTNLVGAASPLLYIDNTAGLYAASFADDILTDNIILDKSLGKTIKVQATTINFANGNPLYISGGDSGGIGMGSSAPSSGGNVYIYGGAQNNVVPGSSEGKIMLAYTGSAARGAVGIGTSSVTSGYLLDVNGNARATDFCTSSNPSKCLSTTSTALTFPIALPATGTFDFTLANDDWTGFNLVNSLINKRIIIGVNATRTSNVFDIEDVTDWNHRMELRADGSAAFNSYVSTAPGGNGGYRIYNNTGHTNGVITSNSDWFEMNYDIANGWGTFQRPIVPTVDGWWSLGDSSRRWGNAYTKGLDVKGDVIIDLT